MKPRNAQAALEYLSTYAFAFMAILVAVGALTYFGVFDTSALRSEDCSFPPGIVCEDFTLSDQRSGASDTELVLELRNSFGVNINVTDISTSNPVASFDDCRLDIGSIWEYEEIALIICDDVSDVTARDKYDVDVTINFTQVGGGYAHHTLGNVFVTAQ